MLLDEFVEIPICGNRVYWENLGYKIPLSTDKWKKGRLSVKRGTKIIVKVKDLPPKSRTKVKRKCDNCGKVDKVRWYAYRDYCSECGKKLFPKKGYSYEEVKKIFEGKGCKLLSDKYVKNDEKLKYICQCGRESKINLANFLIGQRCGCVKSLGERKVEKWLRKNNIKFILQKRFRECKNIRELPFDFYLPKYNTCIEYDGKQHFQPVCFGGISLKEAELNLKKLKDNDKIKEEFCKMKNIYLLRIKYSDNCFEKLNDYLGGC